MPLRNAVPTHLEERDAFLLDHLHATVLREPGQRASDHFIHKRHRLRTCSVILSFV
jgi:hypothetical protein